jgi:hypothetical protein
MMTNIVGSDGFGAQYQRIIQTYIYCKCHKFEFYYCQITKIDHNYENNNDYISNMETTINLKGNIQNGSTNNCRQIDYGTLVLPWFDNNIDNCCKSEHMSFIKKCFWEHKSKNVFNNNCLNVAIHIRRENLHDNGQAGERITTPNEYYLKIMNTIRNKHDNNKQLKFHIYSQGSISNFKLLQKEDVIFHLDEDICKTFIELVGADILVTSPSSLSYVAALISDGEIYYKPFWHKPCSHWNIN